MPDRENAAKIEDDAIEWATKAERGLTIDERRALDSWIDGDSRRLGAFVRAQAVWIHAERAVALGTMPEPGQSAPDEPPPEETRRTQVLSRRTLVGAGGALAASIAVAYSLGFERYSTLESNVGETRHISLRNGAALTLDTDTRVDIANSSDDRALTLVRGKLFIDVARLAGASFSVKAGDLLIETITGAFGVEAVAGAPIVALAVSGRLAISQAHGLFAQDRKLTVDQGHRLAAPRGAAIDASQVEQVEAVERDRLLAWREGMLSFGGEMLADAVRAFDRYGSVRIVVVDPELGKQRITGLFKADDPRGFAMAVADSFGGVVTSDRQSIRISAKKISSA